VSGICKYAHNKAVQADNLRSVCLVVSLSLHCTTRQTAHKLRLTATLGNVLMIDLVYVLMDKWKR